MTQVQKTLRVEATDGSIAVFTLLDDGNVVFEVEGTPFRHVMTDQEVLDARDVIELALSSLKTKGTQPEDVEG